MSFIFVFKPFSVYSVYGVRVRSSFIDLHAAVQLSQHNLLKRLYFSHCIFLPCLLKIDHRCVGLFLGSLFCSIEPYVCFCASTTSLFSFIIYLFLAVLGLRCCAWAFSSCSEQGLLFVAVRGLLIAVASLVAEHRL